MTDKKTKVYIASPYTVGNTEENVKRQIDAASILIDLGYIPFVPLLTHFIHEVHHKSFDQWINYDKEWVKACDVLIRLRPVDTDGNEIPSTGADEEEKTAIENNLTVWTYKTVDEMERDLRGVHRY